MKEIKMTPADLRESSEEGYPVKMNIKEVRDLITLIDSGPRPEDYDELTSALDSAQNAVFTGAKAATYIVIKVETE